MDREAAARAIADEARRTRKRPSRGLWIAAGIASVVCVGALAIGWLTARPAPPSAAHPALPSSGGGFGVGLAIGIGVGLALGCVIGLRARR